MLLGLARPISSSLGLPKTSDRLVAIHNSLRSASPRRYSIPGHFSTDLLLHDLGEHAVALGF